MKDKYVFIGNSIVNGFPLSRGRSFPGLIRAAVREGRTAFDADIINKGVNGNTTREMMTRFHRDALGQDPQAVFLMTGTNDFIYREATAPLCFDNLQVMSDQAAAAGAVPVLMTPLPVNEDKATHLWMSGMGIDYGKVNLEISDLSERIRNCGMLYIDTGSAFADYASRFPDPADAWLDGVHPTADGYVFLAETVIQWIDQHLEDL